MVSLRPFMEADYPEFTALYNRCRPEVLESEASLRAFNAAFKDEELLNIVAFAEGNLVGAVWAHPDPSGEKRVRLDILTDAERQSLARALYDAALGQLTPQAKSLTVRVRENWTGWLDFYTERGFTEYERMWESRLTLATFEATPFAGALERAAASDIVIKTLADLPDDEATQRGLYEAVVERVSRGSNARIVGKRSL